MAEEGASGPLFSHLERDIMRGPKGFTLVELMIVVAIIGILASVGLTIFNSYSRKAKISEVSDAIGAAVSSVQQYRSENNSTPAVWPGNAYDVCKNTFGLTLPTTYVSGANYTATSTAASLTFSALFAGGQKNIGSEVDGRTLTLTSGQDGGMRAWGGTLEPRFLPK